MIHAASQHKFWVAGPEDVLCALDFNRQCASGDSHILVLESVEMCRGFPGRIAEARVVGVENDLKGKGVLGCGWEDTSDNGALEAKGCVERSEPMYLEGLATYAVIVKVPSSSCSWGNTARSLP